MNSFIQNLVRRGAGLPLASAPPVRPAPGRETIFQASESLQEVTTETVAQHQSEIATSLESESQNVVSRISTPPPPVSSRISTPPPPTSSIEANSSVSQVLPEPNISLQPSPGPPLLQHAPVFTPRPAEHTRANQVSAQKIEGSGNVISERESTSNPSSSEVVERQIIVQSKVAVQADADVSQQQAANIRQVVNTVTRHLPEGIMIRPAVPETQVAFEFPRVTPPSQTPPEPIPIHVRVGRVEVRGAPPQTPVRSAATNQSPLGFAAYYRVRKYRS